ncbi:MAG TPA: IS1380 family transposase [Streptosporangiaceae bacterium]|nr:IS1380 family transposase [Streptosporangiaceae bacterium]
MKRIRSRAGKRQQVRVGAPDRSLTPNAGLAAVTELCSRLGVIAALDAAVGPIKQRDRGCGAGELLTGIAAAQLAGEDFLTGLDRQRADSAGQQLTPVPGLSSTTAAGLARRITPGQWQAVEGGLAAVTGRMLDVLPTPRAAALTGGPVTIDLDTTDVEVYGRKKRGVAYNHQGQRVGRPHVATWAETETVLAADLGDGTDDPRATAPDLLRRALAALPPRARQAGRVAMRADAGYFAGQLARAAHDAHISFAIGAKRIAPLWRLLAGLAEEDWHDATGMDGAQVTVAEYCPDWWPADTRLLIRRVRLDPDQVSADPRSRRRRTLHPAQRDMLFPELAQQPAIYAYSFILTNLDVSTPDKAAAAEHWYRHRTTVENIFRDSKLGAALRHLPSGYPQVNLAWMWGALLAATMAAWLHQLTAVTAGEDILAGHGVRGGKAMIATLRWRLIAVPGRLIRHARHLVLRLPPGHSLLPEVLARLRELPVPA